MQLNGTRMKLVPLAAAVVMGSLSAGAQAAPLVLGDLNAGMITLDAVYRMPRGNAGDPTTDGMLAPPASIFNTPGGADMYLFQGGPNNSNVFFHTYGDSGVGGGTTYFGARASGEGSFYAHTYARYSRTFTNNTLLDQIYNFSFNVSDGELNITGAGEGFASLMLEVRKNGTAVSRSSTTRTQDAMNNTTCVEDDLGSLGSYGSCANNYFSGGGYSVSMGSIAPGQSFTLDYDIIATVSGELSQQNGYGYGFSMFFNACGQNPEVGLEVATFAANEQPGDGQNELVCAVPQIFFPGMAIARSGDPFNGPLGGTGGPSDFQTANFQMTVPEPGSLALLGVALAGLAASRRRRTPSQSG